MAFNAGTILAKLRLDAKGFVAGMKTSQKSASGLSTLMKGAFATGIAIGTFKIAEMGGRLIDLENAFDRMTKASGTSAKQVLRDAKAVTGALTNKQIIEAANMLDLLGVGLENTSRFIEIAKAAAIGLNRPIAQMLESIATGTARQSRLWLDNLGIIISITDANEAYAAKLGKTASAMTDTEKRAAFLNAVLDKGDDIIRKVGSEAESAAEPTQALAAQMGDFKDEVSKLVAINLGGWFMAGAKGLKALNEELASEFTQQEIKAVTGGQTIAGVGPADLVQLIVGRVVRRLGLEIAQGTGPEFFTPTMGPRGARLDAKPPAEPGSALPGFRGAPLMKGAVPVRIIGGPLPSVGARLPTTGRDEEFNRFDFPDKERDPGLRFGGGELVGSGEATEAAQEAVAALTQEVELADMAFGTLGNSIEAMFTTLMVDSERAGRVFAAAMLGGIGQVASNMGDLFIGTAMAGMALQSLAFPVALAMGFALKAIGGTLKGIGMKQVPPIVSPRRLSPEGLRERDTIEGSRGSLTINVAGDFMGEKFWIDRLADKIWRAQRDRNVDVVFQG